MATTALTNNDYATAIMMRKTINVTTLGRNARKPWTTPLRTRSNTNAPYA